MDKLIELFIKDYKYIVIGFVIILPLTYSCIYMSSIDFKILDFIDKSIFVVSADIVYILTFFSIRTIMVHESSENTLIYIIGTGVFTVATIFIYYRYFNINIEILIVVSTLYMFTSPCYTFIILFCNKFITRIKKNMKNTRNNNRDNVH